MKKSFIFIAATVALAIVSCAKEPVVKETVAPEPENGTIVFSASVELNAETKATLSDHAIHFVAGDVIGIANNVNDVIEACAVTPDGLDPTKCSFTATAVAGATTYYAICVGDNITGITFDHSTAIFSGLNNPNHTFVKNEVTGSALAMAGKSTNKSSFSLKPCLSLVKIKVAAESVAAKYADGYSGIRGFNLIIKHSGSRINPTGNYAVNLSGEMSVSYVDGGADYIQVNEGSNLMDASANYYLMVIPAGAVETFQFQPFGFNSSSVATWDEIYKLTLSQAASMDPGDYFDLGTINPVGLQKAHDAFVPAITIDGDMSDWASIVTTYAGDGEKIVEWKTTSDAQNVYFYYKIVAAEAVTAGQWESYLVTGFDTDNDDTTGEAGSYGLGGGYEARSIGYAFKNSAGSAIIFRTSPSSSSKIQCPISGDSLGTVNTGGVLSGDYALVELCIPRLKIGSPAAGTIRVRHAFGWTPSPEQTITLN